MSIENKKIFPIGQAVVEKKICLPWSQGIPCLVCEEMCPVPGKAIKVEMSHGYPGVGAPRVESDLCIGCGICQNKCPVEGRAIRVRALSSAERKALRGRISRGCGIEDTARSRGPEGFGPAKG